MKNTGNLVLMVTRVLLGAGLCWLVATKTEGWSVAAPALSSPGLLLAVIAFSLVGGFVEAVRMVTLLRAQGASVALGDAFRLVTAAFTFNFCIPGGATGDLSKIFYLRGTHTGKGWELATAIFVDRLVGLMSMLFLVTLLGAACWPLVRNSAMLLTLFAIAVALMAGVLTFTALCLSTAPALRRWLVSALHALPLDRHLERIAESFFRFSDHRSALLHAFVVSFAGHAAAVAVLTIIGRTLYPGSPASVPPFLSLLGMFANTVTITPGGLGVGEAAFDVLFAQAGLQGGAAVMIIWRIGMLPICLLGVGFYMAGLRPKAA
jgi:glycosyltransferase 2 family protein